MRRTSRDEEDLNAVSWLFNRILVEKPRYGDQERSIAEGASRNIGAQDDRSLRMTS
jgi:hypothetical protein